MNDMAIEQRKKIAVLGGGIGSLSAAFHLTETPGWQDRYEITVYQQGWRLGGKCASGRDQRTDYGGRIYEHGLHLFAGFYHHAFELLTKAYAALDRPPQHPNQTVWDAFTGLDEITLIDQYPQADGSVTCVPWYVNLEPNSLVPGEASTSPTVADLIMTMVSQLIKFEPPNGIFGPPQSPGEPRGEHRHEHLPQEGNGSFLHHAFDAALKLVEKVGREVRDEIAELAVHVIMRTIVKRIEDHLASMAAKERSPSEAQTINNFLMSAFLVQTIVQGVLEDDVLEKGWDVINDIEFSAWLYKHAATISRDYKHDDDPYKRAQALIDWSPIRSIYDYVFGYLHGDPAQRALEAGTGMRGLLKLVLNYRGHLFWTMRGGMGDVVIAPLYLALQKRGVKFEYFSRVTALRPSADKTTIDKIEILRQAKLKSGTYQPLIFVPATGWELPLEAWPEEPLWDQLVDGDTLRGTDFEYAREPVPPAPNQTLVRGVDFDEVILGIAVGALHTICADLSQQKSRWKAMLGAVETTPTVALQLWYKRTTDDLGCPAPGRTTTAMIEPFSTWADMTHLLSREDWRGYERPVSIAYFCGQLPPSIARDDGAHAAVGKLAESWLTQHAFVLWPRTVPVGSATGFDWSLLFDPANGDGKARFQSQYWRANINPSDRYVMSVPGSTIKRLRADESGYNNLFLTGDWTRNGLNAGAAEAAAMAGVQCANAMRGDLTSVHGECDV